MNREIKFRAWHNVTKEWLEPNEFNIRLNNTGVQNNSCAGIIGGVELMQYIGLTDNANKEIYEGDILQDEEGDIFEIFWSKDEARFKADLIGEKGKVYDEFGMNDCFGLVIGNIYENPNIYKELLINRD